VLNREEFGLRDCGDQADPDKVHKVNFTDGSVSVEIQTESIHGSGNDRAIYRLDPKDGRLAAKIQHANEPHGLAMYNGVW